MFSELSFFIIKLNFISDYSGHAIGVPVMRTRSGSGDHTHKHGSVEGGGIRRSVSDSSLYKKSKQWFLLQ